LGQRTTSAVEPLEARCLLSGVDWAEPLAAEEAGPLYGSASPGGYTPAQMRHAYGYDQIFFEGGSIVGDGTGQTIAIVNAYHTPNAAADLAAFSTYFGLPAPPSFVQVDQYGGTSFPGSSPGWALETALDVQWAHALAPGASILLVEANSASFSDLMAAVDYARNYEGVSVVSLSWGANEFSTETNRDQYFTTPAGHTGVTFVGAAGNSGGPGVYPAYSPNVLAVGGTTLTLDAAGNRISETAWSGSGGGISQYEAQPYWQNGVVTQTTTHRAMPDVAFEANPSTGVPVYDTYNNTVSAPWTKVAGTSFAAPAWASLVTIANQGRELAGLPMLDMTGLMTTLYAMPADNFNDITSGSSGGSIPQSAAPGYDLVTGRGTPKAPLVVQDLVGVSAAPGGLTLTAASDTGVSSSDRITRLNNSGPGAVLQFEVNGTVAGATVTILADGTPIGSAVASGATTIVTTSGLLSLLDGAHEITAQQSEPGMLTSSHTGGVEITVDTTAPSSTIVGVEPDPRTSPVGEIAIQFNEPVSGLSLMALNLSRSGGANLLTGAQSVSSAGGQYWTLGNLAGVTAQAGLYELSLTSALAPVVDLAGNVAGNATTSFTVTAAVLGRALFYNESAYDGHNTAINAADDLAIATDKSALLPGAGAATFANISSYRRGINGVMIDLAGAGPGLSAADFAFRVGNNNAPGSWAAAPAPTAFSVRPGAGAGGSDRVEFTWATGAIANLWLEVIVEAGANTGLASDDVFYFGNRIGDTGTGTPTLAITSATDELAARGNPGAGAAIGNLYDFDRNGIVNAVDSLTSRGNAGTLVKINIGTPPAAPQSAVGVDDEGGEAAPQVRFDAELAFALSTEWMADVDEPLVEMLARSGRTGRRGR
jgi:hypothetical protein